MEYSFPSKSELGIRGGYGLRDRTINMPRSQLH